MKLRGPKNKNLYDTIKRSIQFIRVTRLVSIVDCQQSFFVSLVDLVSERKLERAQFSFALADFCSPQFPLANEIDAGKKQWCLGDGEGKPKKFGIKQVDKVRKRITKLTFRALPLRRHFPIRLRR